MLKFTKMQALGNDYIYIDGIHQDVPMDPSFIQRISDRHQGIGSDGMIVILPSHDYDFKMRMFNLDGSEAKMCGNGIRCFAKFVYDHHFSDKTYLEIETLGGVKKVWLTIDNHQVSLVKVDMGEPILETSCIPCLFEKKEMINEPIDIDGNIYHMTSLSVGNPHTVIFVDDLNFDIETIGKKIEKHVMFPESVNTEFIRVIDRTHIQMRVWERGSGETKACGTGATAAMYASYLLKKCDEHVTVELLGGTLDIMYANGHLFMSGEAKTVFEGEIKEDFYV